MHQETDHQASKGHQGRYYCTTVLPYFCEVTTIPMPKPCNHRHRSSEGPSCFELDESFPTRRHSQQSAKYCVSEPDLRDPIVDPDDRPISGIALMTDQIKNATLQLWKNEHLEPSSLRIFLFFSVIRRSLRIFFSHQAFASTGSSHCGINIPPIVTNEVPIESYGRVRRNRRISSCF